jgi:hypothetical protein
MDWTTVVASAIAAAGTVLSGYIALRVAQTRNIVNGQMDDLRTQLALLTGQLATSQERIRVAELPALPSSWPPADPDQAA